MRRVLVALLLFASPLSAGTVDLTKGGSGSVTFAKGGSGTVVRDFLAAAPACSGNFLTDNFTESGSGTINLNTHTADSGNTWLGTPASDGSIVLDRTNDEIKSTNTGGVTETSYSDVSPGCANYSVFCSAKTGTTGSSNRVGVLGRFSPDTGSGTNSYRFRIEGDGTARLEKVVNGTATDLDTATISSFSASTYYTLELRMVGSTISGYVNSVLECIATDSTHAGPGTAAILLRNGNVRMTSMEADYQ